MRGRRGKQEIIINQLTNHSKESRAGMGQLPQCDPKVLSELFQLSDNAICDARNAFGIEAIHHRRDDLELVLEGEINKVRIEYNSIRRSQSGIVREEHIGRNSRDVIYLGLGVLSCFRILNSALGLENSEF